MIFVRWNYAKDGKKHLLDREVRGGAMLFKHEQMVEPDPQLQELIRDDLEQRLRLSNNIEAYCGRPINA